MESLESRVQTDTETSQRPKSETITVYTSLFKKSEYTSEVFDLVKDYFREELGLNIDFKYCKAKDIPKRLNHRTEIGIIEMEEKSISKMLFKKVKKDLMKSDSDFSFYRRDRIANSASKKVTKKSTALADVKNGRVIIKGVRQLDHFSIKDKARIIIHEIGHLAGLYHVGEYSNDGLRCVNIPGNPLINVMYGGFLDKLRPYTAKYSFYLQEPQKKQMIDYFSGEDTYKRMRSACFNFGKFLKEQESRLRLIKRSYYD